MSWARARRAELTVNSLEINIADSSSRGHLVTSAQVRSWLGRSGIRTVGAKAESVNLARVEELIADNGFVDRVNAYITYTGELHIDVSQCRPVVRLLTDGADFYITSDGYVFPAPRSSSVYVPVITGPYALPFSATYSGSVRKYVDAEKRRIDGNIAHIEKEKYPFYERERTNDENIRALRRMRVKKRWFEKEESFAQRVRELRDQKAALRRRYRYEEALIEQGIAGIEQKQATERREQKKLEKNYEDFSKLITFVKFIEKDDFWRSEVVQIVASTSVSGALEVGLVPRSGNHLILFGRMEDVEQKFDKLLCFYRGGLNNIGWESYATIDLRYADQVVCKK